MENRNKFVGTYDPYNITPTNDQQNIERNIETISKTISDNTTSEQAPSTQHFKLKCFKEINMRKSTFTHYQRGKH